MTIISPSLLSCDFLNMEAELKAFEEAHDIWFHLDVMDGHFVPNLTFGHSIIKKISQATKITLDAHLMVSNPDFYIESLREHGLYNLTFHLEAGDDSLVLIKKAKKSYPSVGISIKPNTEVEALSDEILKLADLVLVMSVEPGFGGQKFMPNALHKIRQLTEKREQLSTEFVIQVDGGIDQQTAQDVIRVGGDNLVAGSYVFKGEASTYLDKIESLRSTL